MVRFQKYEPVLVLNYITAPNILGTKIGPILGNYPCVRPGGSGDNWSGLALIN